MQKVKEKEEISLQQREWVMRISADSCPNFENVTRLCTATNKTVQILQVLGVSAKLSGYRCLICAIPLVADSPGLLMKEVYPDVAKRCGLNDYRCVERTIRSAIRNAWKNRNDAVWGQFFCRDRTGEIICPSNKEFIARLAAEL